MDKDCAICHALSEAMANLDVIRGYISIMSSSDEEFGLKESYIAKQIEGIDKAMNWHQYYHSTGKSLCRDIRKPDIVRRTRRMPYRNPNG